MSTLSITINQCSIEDIEHFLFDNSCAFNPPFASSVDIVSYAQKLKRYAVLIELRDNDNLVGLLAAYINQQTKVAYVPYVCVASENAGRGCGAKLLNALYERCCGCRCVELEVRVDNMKATRFYEKNGFVIVEPRGDKYYMRKEI